ncbi:DNA polymerase IV [Oxobacter pfennigii]|uniref:DNA polymerase IV n=1 Tax=Oxobacter pfennigii TaxID=36849 RepID=A0A0N8NSZ3_9CLOT|nr:DNA polymerase IV [Oxobacter pfennigii]KPU43392.1 DNA polymerase IV [Oxobacter pfennigii]
MDKVIFLVDMNAFFIGCEMARNPELKGKPAAVAGDPKKRTGIILAANYDARKYGVKTTMLVHKARELCPQLKLVPPDHEYYESVSKKVMELLGEYSPVIEQNSIDEAWMDMTGCEALFGKPVDMAQKIMKDIMERLDLWCSIGISQNKFLAKMASELKKPLGITELWQGDIKEKLWPLPVRDMYGIGKQTEKKLLDFGIQTIGDIAKWDKELLFKAFGKYGYELYNLAKGIDYGAVSNSPVHKSKSISRSTTLEWDINDIEYAKTVIMKLSEEVGEEARKLGLKGRTVSIVIKYSDFQSITRQRSIPPTYLTKDIYNTGISLLKENWNINRFVRLLGIGIDNFEGQAIEQISLLDAESSNDSNKEECIERVMDKIRDKYGRDKIKRAKLI